MDDLDQRLRLEGLFSSHAAALRAYARRRVAAGAADDVVSEVSVVAWRRLNEVPDDALLWLLGCAQRIIANQRRSARRQTALFERLSREPRDPLQVHELGDSVLGEALATLTDGDREVLMLIAWEGLDPAGQRAAAEQLAGRTGTIVVLDRDPATLGGLLISGKTGTTPRRSRRRSSRRCWATGRDRPRGMGAAPLIDTLG